MHPSGITFWRMKAGIPIDLPDTPWRQGGEASIYRLSHEVAKIYHELPDDVTAERIRFLVEYRPKNLGSGFVTQGWAWPTDAVIDPDLDNIWGSVSPCITGSCQLAALFDRNVRSSTFADLTCRHLPKIAANLMEIVRQTHEFGIILGDISPSNLLVDGEGGITIVDLESAQISTRRGLLPCNVGTPDYLAPEIAREGNFAGVERDWRHDSFSLGAVSYQLLTGGVHFCDGGAQVKAGEWPPVDRAQRITMGAWHASTRKNAPVAILPPDNAVNYEAFGRELGQLYRRCFDAGFEDPDQRPTVVEWRDGFRRFVQELRPCHCNPRHYIHASLYECPWCDVASRSGVDPFPHVT
jgi:DNA-binding helix-hairpin-helix protein with protein kinase domain